MSTEVAEPPTQTDTIFVPPQVPESKEAPKAPAGGKGRWQAELDKLTPAKTEDDTKVEKATTSEATNIEQVIEPKKDTSDKNVVEPATKITSPLDVVTAGKKPEVKEPDPVEEFDDKTPDWKRARQLMRTQRDEKKALETSIAELKKAPKADPEEVKRLSQERDTLKQSLAEREELIKSVDIRMSKEYRDALQKRDTKLSKVANKAKAYGADADALIGALSLPDGSFKTQQIKAAMAEVDPEDKTEIRLLIGEVDVFNDQLSEFEKDAPKKYEEIQAKREATLREQQEASVKAIHAEFGKITDALPSDVVTLREVPEDVPGGTEWNQNIKTARENALRILSPGGSDFNESAAVAYKGAHYDALMNMFLKDHIELVESRKRLAEFDSGGPDFKGGEKPKGEPKLTPSQKFHKVMEQGRAAQDD